MTTNVDWLAQMEGQSGVYFVSSQNKPLEGTDYYLIKVGMARATTTNSLRTRIESYMLYWPLGVHVFGIIQTHDDVTARTLESRIHGFLVSKRKHIHFTQSTHLEEWFWLKLADIKAICDALKPLSRKVLIYPKKPYTIRENKDDVFPRRHKATPDWDMTDWQKLLKGMLSSGVKGTRAKSRIEADDDDIDTAQRSLFNKSHEKKKRKKT